MVGWLPKYYVECPRCGSIEVDVPWGLPRARQRRRLALALAALWGTYLGWIALAAALGSALPWTLAGAGYLAVSAGVLARARRSLRQLVCVRCAYRWPA